MVLRMQEFVTKHGISQYTSSRTFKAQIQGVNESLISYRRELRFSIFVCELRSIAVLRMTLLLLLGISISKILI